MLCDSKAEDGSNSKSPAAASYTVRRKLEEGRGRVTQLCQWLPVESVPLVVGYSSVPEGATDHHWKVMPREVMGTLLPGLE
jgi:hypothetical protein